MTVILDLDFIQTVYLKTDDEQKPRMVTEVKLYPGCLPIYGLSCGADASWHYRGEITTEKNDILILQS